MIPTLALVFAPTPAQHVEQVRCSTPTLAVVFVRLHALHQKFKMPTHVLATVLQRLAKGADTGSDLKHRVGITVSHLEIARSWLRELRDGFVLSVTRVDGPDRRQGEHNETDNANRAA